MTEEGNEEKEEREAEAVTEKEDRRGGKTGRRG